jgi:hypothetical protein
MADTSEPNTGIPYVASQQSSPEITCNEAFNMLAMLAAGVVIAQTDAPPGSPVDGGCYLVGAAGSGAWTGYDNCLAGYYGGTWLFVPGLNSLGSPIGMGAPQKGWVVYNQALDEQIVFSGSAWGVL